MADFNALTQSSMESADTAVLEGEEQSERFALDESNQMVAQMEAEGEMMFKETKERKL
jgi:hypothetical protein